MGVKLYKMDLSPPARAAMMACEAFNVPVEMIDVNLIEKDNMKPEFIKKNPLHTVPVLEDGDIILHDSHAILMYLADKYGKDDSMYPKDTKKRALVNQKLFFDAGTLFPRLRIITYSILIEGSRTISQKNLDNITDAYDILEQFLSQNKYLAGDNITIADLSAISDVSSLVYLVPIDANKYPKTSAWFKDIEEKSYCQKYNKPGATELGQLVQQIVKQCSIIKE